ncbi:ABC transporter permease [Heliophilum fasciatum]|uniref:Nucleoside ABC transporter membrane protein n=1 Tax=Heliophilum fasciatum TaxID=35700 RepID=A0A4V2SW47_9FIRM|nr:ABC transporter permease [Heliophilum fasciatum]MCW2279197.1 simple sugar transport system permease protein [Heliophilum fasciatum]TCP60986.1 nucleoside ABC transporter membrane protein [Heliophilum fasciatum]
MEVSPWIAILATGIVAGIPILLAALGEILAERAGVINLGVEGMMLIGAVVGFMVSLQSNSPWVGLIAAVLAGAMMALIHAFLTITLRANQVVSGLALTIFGTGLSGYLGKSFIGVPLTATFKPVPVPGLSQIPAIGPIFFNHDLLVYIAYGLVALLWFFLFRTRSGLELRAVGENPAAADAAGLNVFLIRYACVIAGGMFAGMAGAYLSLAYAPSWLENMTAGRGWIAVALVIFGVWNPTKAFLGSFFFGTIDVLGFHMQTLGIVVSSFFLKMLPYVFTIAVLIVATRETKTRRVAIPEALGVPYVREER